MQEVFEIPAVPRTLGSDGAALLPTFRDPAGSVVVTRNEVLRTVVPAHTAETLDFLATDVADRLIEEGSLIGTTIVRVDEDGLELVHPRVPFISYPSEWIPSQWHAAASLTLRLAKELVREGWILKDATPLNVLFRGTVPVFVDFLSIRRIEPTPIWFAYGQFVRTFLLPLFAHRQLGWRLQSAQTWRDGIEPEELYAPLSWWQRLRQPGRSLVTLPVQLGKIMSSAVSERAQPSASPKEVEKTLLKALTGLQRNLKRVTPQRKNSNWADYTETAGHYSAEEQRTKQAFVAEVLDIVTPHYVLDVGCNTGVFSRMAAAGASVVAIDQDVAALERLYAHAEASGADILPLCVDLSFPTPATGWDNHETQSFLERAEGHFDTVMMLAVIHHLLLSAQIPLGLIAELCSRLTTRNLILEWVPPSDPKFIEVLRGREAIYTHITEEAFRCSFGSYFRVERELTLDNGRILLHFVRR